jgi:hypothetical protein
LIELASNLRRSKRTVGRRIGSLQSAVGRLQKRPAPQRLAPGVVERENLAPNADGKTRVFYQNDAPTNPTDGIDLVAGDLWFDTNDPQYRMYRWDGSAWVVAVLSGTNITAGTIDALNVNVSNINAGSITTGTLSSITIQSGTPTGGIYPFQVSSAGAMRASGAIISGTLTASVGTIGGFTLSSTGMYAERNVGGTIYRSEMFTNSEGVYVPTNIRNSGGNGFFTTNASTGQYTTQIPIGLFVSSSTGDARLTENYLTVMVGSPTPVGRMWMNGNVIRYTSTGSGSFPGLIVETRTSLTFEDDFINSFGRIRSASKAGGEFCFVAQDSAGDNTIVARSDGGVLMPRLGSGTGTTVVITGTGRLRESSSSITYKENVEYFEDSAISIINKLKPATFTYKRDEQDTDFTYELKQLDRIIGLIVEDVEEVQKDLDLRLLTYRSTSLDIESDLEQRDRDPYTAEEDFKDMVPQMYRVESILALCVKAIQELSARIDRVQSMNV